MKLALTLALSLVVVAPALAQTPPEFLAAAEIPGTTADKSGLTDPMRKNLPPNLLGSFGSGLAYAGHDNLYFAASDRGPGDGDSDFRTRFHQLRITLSPESPRVLTVDVVSTSLLTDSMGRSFVGSLTAFDTVDQAFGMRLDPEAIAVSPAGTIWTSDEYGPFLDEWSPTGKHLRRVKPPAKFLIANPAGETKSELPPFNTSGRQANRGFEGMALSPDGTRLYALLQGPLIQDGALDKQKRIGTNVRLVEWRIDGDDVKPAREFVYQLDDASHGLNELTSVQDGVFLVIEKDGKPGDKARARKIYRIDIRDASDVSSVASLPSSGLADSIKPVSKTLILDLLDPRYGLAGPSMPEKVEGLALGPSLPDGRSLLFIATDNDYILDAPSWVWAFAIDHPSAPQSVQP